MALSCEGRSPDSWIRNRVSGTFVLAFLPGPRGTQWLKRQRTKPIYRCGGSAGIAPCGAHRLPVSTTRVDTGGHLRHCLGYEARPGTVNEVADRPFPENGH